MNPSHSKSETDLSGDVGVYLEVGHHLQNALIDRGLTLAAALQRGRLADR